LDKDKSRRKRSERVKQKSKASPNKSIKESKEFKSGLKVYSNLSHQKNENIHSAMKPETEIKNLNTMDQFANFLL
jgi:hypothetical protein